MNYRKPIIVGLTLLLALSFSGDVLADISNAAVLFLRIAPGSRAAGMGEAYVALADDATATHWNPAGLGSHPLADTWIESKIPEKYMPLTGFAPVSTGDDKNYLDYDVWAITPEGLIRYDNKSWYTYEVFGTRTDETALQKIKGYFRVSDDERLEMMMDKVAAANNRGSYDELVALQEKVFEAVPKDYDRYETMVSDFDSLLICYELCRINWSRVKEMREKLEDGLEDDTLNSTEIDRVAVALERSRNRFLPEELKIPYNALFAAEPTAIATTGKILLVGSSEGLARYNGENWEMSLWEDGSPVTGVTTLHSVGQTVIVGTSDGLGEFRGLSVVRIPSPAAEAPVGPEALGGNSLTDLYAVIDGELYSRDLRTWSRARIDTVGVGETLEAIAARYSIYDSDEDIQRFIDKYRDLNASLRVEAPVTPEGPTEIDTTGAVSDTATAEMAEPEAEPVRTGIPGIDFELNPGDEIIVPLVASLKGEVTAIHDDLNGWLWVGTDHGIFYFDGHRWVAYGYRDHVVAEGETLQTLAELRVGSTDVDSYLQLLRVFNDLEGEEVSVGDTVKLYANPAGQPVNSIGGDGRMIYIATANGLLEFNGREWSRSGLRGLTNDNIVDMVLLGNETWIASDERLVIKGRGHSEISLMHVNWLPELADDLYYEFLSVVTNKEGWGTFGGSITFISYGKFVETDAFGNRLGEFDSFDYAIALSYGMPLTSKLKGGASVKFIYSRLAPQGQGKEQGTGTASGFAIDIGILYHLSSRLTFGAALTNLGPKLTYIDAAQSDELPRNLAVGLSYQLLRSDYISLLFTAEVNKLMVGLDDDLSEEAKQTVINGGAEFTYADLFAFRGGYIYDQEGDIKTPTLGFGLSPFSWGEFDFAYIPSQEDFSLANTLRISLRVIL